jgi:hypothetical protein
MSGNTPYYSIRGNVVSVLPKTRNQLRGKSRDDSNGGARLYAPIVDPLLSLGSRETIARPGRRCRPTRPGPVVRERWAA